VQPFFGGTAAQWNLPADYTYSENGLGFLAFGPLVVARVRTE